VKKILFITYYWPPSGGAGVQRSLKFVKNLPQFGFQPIILTVDPDKATYPVLDESLTNEVAAGTLVVRTDSFEPLRLLKKFSGGKVKIPYGGFTNQRKEKLSQRILRFIRGNFFLPDARVGWVKYATREAAVLIRKYAIDTIVISSPPHSSQLIGLALKRQFPSIRWVADLRDPWTDIYYYDEMLHMPFAKRVDQRYEHEVLSTCDAGVVVSDAIQQLFAGKLADSASGKFYVLPNGFDPDDFTGAIVPPKDVFRITYVGTIADSYKPDVFFEALGRLRKKYPQLPLQLRMVGSPASNIPILLEKYNLHDAADFLPLVSHAEAIRFMRESSLLLLLIPDTLHAKGILTGKLFEYLGAGVPIVGVGPADGDAAKIISSSETGRLFSRDDVDGLFSFLENAYLKWKENSDLRHGKNVSRFDRSSQAKQLAAILNELK
jgi:glycosyltransferase involved in cell wall biosynthesis